MKNCPLRTLLPAQVAFFALTIWLGSPVQAMDCRGLNHETQALISSRNQPGQKPPNDSRAPVNPIKQYRDLANDQEVIATITVYNGNANLASGLGPGLTTTGRLPVERFLTRQKINFDLRKVNQKDVFVYEVKLGAKRPDIADRGLFGDLITAVTARFVTNFEFRPSKSILEGNVFYGRVISQKLVEYYTTNFGFEVVKLPPAEQAKLNGSTLIRATLGSLLEHTSSSQYQIASRPGFEVESIQFTDTANRVMDKRAHYYNANDIGFGSGYKSGHYSTAIVEALKVIEAAYSNPKLGTYADQAIRALTQEFAISDPVRKDIIVITRNKKSEGQDAVEVAFNTGYRDIYELAALVPMYRKAVHWHMKMARHLKQFARVVEDGTGAGLMGAKLRHYLRSLSAHFLHVDISSKMLSLAKKRIPPEDLVEGDILHNLNRNGNTLTPNSVDHVFSHSVLWNLNSTAQYFQQKAQILKRGGTLAISTIREMTYEREKMFLEEVRRQCEQLKAQGKMSVAQAEELLVANRVLLQNLKSPRSLEQLIEEAESFGFEVVETARLYRYGKKSSDYLMNGILFRYNP